MLKKIKEKLKSKNTLIYFLSFIIPVVILVGYVLYNQILTDHDFFKNGENFLTADMGSQYNALYNYIRNVFLGKDSIFYSFHNSLGGNMASTIGYYLASPFNVLYIFVSKSNIPLMTYIIYVLKISLCSLFMSIFLCHKFGHKYTNLIFSLSYAFMGFVVAYFFNNMWLDVIYMTPLVIMGIDKLIDGKMLMYVITLCLSIMFNFYIAYMLCIFCVMYFIYELFTRYSIKDFKSYRKIIIRFIISSLLSAGLAAFFLVPVLLDLSRSMRSSVDSSMFNLDYDSSNWFQHFLNTVFSKTLAASNNKVSLLGRKRPVVYISLFCLILAYLYFFNKKIKRKEKVLSLGIILIFLVSFMSPHLQYLWQGMSFPNGYIDRYSFLYCFFLILLSAKCFYNRNHIKLIWFILFFIAFIAGIYLIYKYRLPYLNKQKYIINIIIVLIYLVCSFVYFNLDKDKARDIVLLIFIFVGLELTYNYMNAIVLLENAQFSKYYKSACSKFNSIENNFYRVDGSYFATLIDSFACDYYDSTTAISTSNKDLYNFYYNYAGNVTTIGLYNDYGSMPILNSLMGINYIINVGKINDPTYEYYKKIKSDNKFAITKHSYIYKNNEALSIGYIIDNDFEKNVTIDKKSGFKNLNNLINAMTGKEYIILEKIDKEVVEKKSLYRYHIDRDDSYLYLNVNYEMGLNFSPRYDLFIDDKLIFSATDGFIGSYKFKNKYYDNDIMIRIANISLNDIYDIDLYYFNEKEYKKAINDLKKYQLKNINVKNNKLSGNIKLDEDGLLFMSIPYDKGWHIYVDGKKVSYKKLANAFIGVDLSKGNHKITMKFYPRGLLVGSLISATSLVLIVIYNKRLKKSNKTVKSLHKSKKKKKQTNDS